MRNRKFSHNFKFKFIQERPTFDPLTVFGKTTKETHKARSFEFNPSFQIDASPIDRKSQQGKDRFRNQLKKQENATQTSLVKILYYCYGCLCIWKPELGVDHIYIVFVPSPSSEPIWIFYAYNLMQKAVWESFFLSAKDSLQSVYHIYRMQMPILHPEDVRQFASSFAYFINPTKSLSPWLSRIWPKPEFSTPTKEGLLGPSSFLCGRGHDNGKMCIVRKGCMQINFMRKRPTWSIGISCGVPYQTINIFCPYINHLIDNRNSTWKNIN